MALPWHEAVTAQTVARDRALLAGTTTAAVLDHFSRHPSQWVRRDVAAHPCLSPTTMAAMANDDHLDIPTALLRRKDLPGKLRWQLFEYACRWRGLADFTAHEPTTPSYILEELLKRADDDEVFTPFTIRMILWHPNLKTERLSSELLTWADEVIERCDWPRPGDD